MVALKYRQIPGASLNTSSDVFPCVNALRILFCLALYPHVFVVSSSCAVNGGSPLIVSIQYSWSDKGVVTSWVVIMPHSPNELVNTNTHAFILYICLVSCIELYTWCNSVIFCLCFAESYGLY